MNSQQLWLTTWFSVFYVDGVVDLDLNWKALLSANNMGQEQAGSEQDRAWE